MIVPRVVAGYEYFDPNDEPLSPVHPYPTPRAAKLSLAVRLQDLHLSSRDQEDALNRE